MSNPNAQARIAALLYLVVVGTSSFALITVSSMSVRGDAAATAVNIAAGESMFRLAVAANLIAAVAYTAVVAMFYALFKPVNATLSLVAGFIGLAGCASSATFMLNQLEVLILVGDGLGGFSPEQSQAMARHSLRLGAQGNSLSLVFFGFYCLCLGALVLVARFLPRLLGALLLLAGVGWLVGNLGALIVPDLLGGVTRILIPVSGVGELLFALWLLAFGVDNASWRKQAGA